MTIAVSLKINDGVVLSADSASTIMGRSGVENVYNNANKVYNLRKGLPIGLITWGLGGLGGLSTSTLAKDLRRRFTGDDPDHHDWKLDPDNYKMADVAERVREFFYDEHYKPAADAYESHGEDDPGLPGLGFICAGYSSDEHFAEEYLMTFEGQQCEKPRLLRGPTEAGASWSGQPEAITRLVNGRGSMLGDVLVKNFGLKPEDIPGALSVIDAELGSPIVNPAMPFQDAIDLAEWLVELTISYTRFMPGAATVGGPVETAAISKHEGFKWVRRKHYFDPRLNPEAP